MTTMMDTILDPVEAADYVVSNGHIEEREDIFKSELDAAGMRVEDINDLELIEVIESYGEVIC